MKQIAPMKLRSRTVFLTPLLVLAAAACGKKGGDEKPLEPAVFGKAVAPPGELGKLKIGMPLDEARKVAPAVTPKDGEEYDSFDSGYAGMRYGVGLDDDKRIDQLRADIPTSAKDVLVKAWGPPQEVGCYDKTCLYWFDPATRMRAVVSEGFRDNLEIKFQTYTPMDQLLGKTPGALAFEAKTPILGATPDALKAAYASILDVTPADPEKQKEESLRFELPPTPYENLWTPVHVTEEKGTIKRAWFDISYDGYPAAKPELLAAFEAAWGKGTPITDLIGRQKTVWLDPAAGRRATLDASDEGRIQVELTPYLPLARLLGEGGDKLGFETTPLIGMTWAELEQAYPAYVETETDEEAKQKRANLEHFMGEDKGKLAVLGEAKGGTSFQLPGTEWGTFTLVHLRYDDAGKVKQFAFGIPWGERPEDKEPILAALEQKYGAKKEITKYGRTKYELRAAAPRVVVELDDITKKWDVEVGAD